MKVKKADNLVVQVYNNLVPSLRLLKHQLLYVTERDETADDSVVVAAVFVVPLQMACSSFLSSPYC